MYHASAVLSIPNLTNHQSGKNFFHKRKPEGYARYDVTNTCQQCQLVRKNKVIIKTGWREMEIGFPLANYILIKGCFQFSHFIIGMY